MRLVHRSLIALATLIALLPFARPRTAETVPLYAARTGLMCQSCHFDPNGGGSRNDFGFAFARNRHSLEAEDSTSKWHDLDVVNRIGDRMPVYLGLNQRFMLYGNTSIKSDSLDRFGFFNMENAIHIAFQPHAKLALVYSADAFSNRPPTSAGAAGVFRSKEAFGWLQLPWSLYLKAGRFRSPFGLRMDDHTVATRNGFSDLGFGSPDFLPYDAREADMGYEIGADRGGWFGRAAFTNGHADALTGTTPFAEAKAAKLGFSTSGYQGGLSVYDDFDHFTDERQTRWGYYTLSHYGPTAFLGEIAAGTDDNGLGVRTNKLAGWAEVDYALRRDINVRLRYDRSELDRSSSDSVRTANTHQRYSIEGEFVPVPFAEIRWTFRYIDHKDAAHTDAKQAYVQLHFSY